MTGATLFVAELQKRGVSFIATLCGHGLNPLYAACREANLRLVDVRNEQSASYIAEAYGRLSRSVGVCATSSGVGHVNAMTGVVNAFFDGAPILQIAGSASTRTAGMGHFQDLDQVALASPVCKYARIIDRPERIPEFVHEAFTAALSGRPGPVHLTFPMDIQNSEVDPDRVVRVMTAPGRGGLSGSSLPAASPAPGSCGRPGTVFRTSLAAPADPDLISEAARIISSSERPLIIAGSGVYYAGGEDALAEFARSQAIPVHVPIWDRGSVPLPMDEFMGILGATSGSPGLLQDADAIIMAGASCDYRVGYLQPPAIRNDARIVRIDPDPRRLGQLAGAHLSILGDPRSVFAQLTAVSGCGGAEKHRAWLLESQERRDVFRQGCAETGRRASTGLKALDIIDAVRSVLTDDTVIGIDGGNIGQWAHQLLCDRYPGHWVTCGSGAVVGNGLPGAMAARLLYPDRPIVLISGDGALTFTIAELESAARQRLGFVVVVADDQAWGIVLSGQERELGARIKSELGPIRFDQVAKGFGARGVTVSSADEIAPAIRDGLSLDIPTVIQVPIARSGPSDM